MGDSRLDDIVDADDLVEVARATRVLVLRLEGIKGENGVLSRIEAASESLDKIDANLLAAVEKVGNVAKIGEHIQELPERLLSLADSPAFRTAVSRIMSEETGTVIETIQQTTLDKLEHELTRLADRLADDVFGRKIAPAMRDASVLARAKTDCEILRERLAAAVERAVSAEGVLKDRVTISEETVTSIKEQIEKIRLSKAQPNHWALLAIFALGWGSALFAGAGWVLVTTWILGQQIPYPWPWS